MPSRNPVVVVSGVLKSPWPSNQMSPTSSSFGDAPARPAMSPTVALQLPESTKGKRPEAVASCTRSASIPNNSKAVVISARKGLVVSNTSERISRPVAASTSSNPLERRYLGPAPMRRALWPES